MSAKPTEEEITRYADMFSAIGAGPRLRIMRALLSAYSDGMIVSDIGAELGIPVSTLSHHLEKLKRRPGEGEPGRNLSLVLGKHRQLSVRFSIALTESMLSSTTCSTNLLHEFFDLTANGLHGKTFSM